MRLYFPTILIIKNPPSYYFLTLVILQLFWHCHSKYISSVNSVVSTWLPPSHTCSLLTFCPEFLTGPGKLHLFGSTATDLELESGALEKWREAFLFVVFPFSSPFHKVTSRSLSPWNIILTSYEKTLSNTDYYRVNTELSICNAPIRSVRFW